MLKHWLAKIHNHKKNTPTNQLGAPNNAITANKVMTANNVIIQM